MKVWIDVLAWFWVALNIIVGGVVSAALWMVKIAGLVFCYALAATAIGAMLGGIVKLIQGLF